MAQSLKIGDNIIMGKPKLEKIEEKLKQGRNFKLTRERYIKLTGVDIPQNKYYTENNSAISRVAKEYGFEIKVIPEQLEFRKME